jgi:hypothetical protein
MSTYLKAFALETQLEKLHFSTSFLHKKIKRLEKAGMKDEALQTRAELKKTYKVISEKHEEANKLWREYAFS